MYSILNNYIYINITKKQIYIYLLKNKSTIYKIVIRRINYTNDQNVQNLIHIYICIYILLNIFRKKIEEMLNILKKYSYNKKQLYNIQYKNKKEYIYIQNEIYIKHILYTMYILYTKKNVYMTKQINIYI